MQLSDKIRIIRKARGLSQEGLGFSLSRVSENGISRQAVSDWENGKSEPKLENIRDLAKVLGVSFDALLDESIDLDDPQVLERVLLRENSSNSVAYSPDVTASFSLHIYHNEVHPRKFKKTICSGVFALLAIAFGLFGLLNPILYYVCMVFGYIWLLTFVIALINEILYAAKGKMSKLIGSIGYYSMSIDDEYVQIPGYNSVGNHFSIPTEKILDIKLGENQKRQHGDVIVTIEGKSAPMTVLDIMKPQHLVDTFNNVIKPTVANNAD